MPSPESPWTLSASIDGHAVHLAIPDELPSITALPPWVETKVGLRQRNVKVLAALARRTEETLSSAKLDEVPQFRRTMENLVLSVHVTDVVRGDPLWRHRPVLEKIPDYTRLAVFAPEPLVAGVLTALQSLGLGARSRVFGVSVGARDEAGLRMVHDTTTWAQDLFLVASDGSGTEWILLPAARKQISDLARPDNDYVEALADPPRRRVLRVPVFFSAGNLIVARASDGPVLLVGGEQIAENSAETYDAAFFTPPAPAFGALLRRITGAERNVEIPNSPSLFHIDLALAILDERTAVVLDPIDPDQLAPSDRAALDVASRALAAMGLHIVKIPTTARWVRSFRSPVNVVPFVDRRDGVRTVLVPRYDDSVVRIDGHTRDLNDLVVERYRQAGFRVISIEDRFNEKNGDIHCAFNVLD